MVIATHEPGIVPIFKKMAFPNERKSKEAGRPIFDEKEIVELRFAGNRDAVSVFPAHDVTGFADAADGSSTPVTYAERFPKQYEQFKKSDVQTLAGTPLEQAPFLTTGQRAELKGLNIFTVETLASLSGTPLKQLGPGGAEYKRQATAYLEAASGTANADRLLSENEELKLRLAELEAKLGAGVAPGEQAAAEGPDDDIKDSPFYKWSDADLRDHIESETTEKPHGNTSHATLVRRAIEIGEKTDA